MFVFECKICGKRLKKGGNHLLCAHSINVMDYVVKYEKIDIVGLYLKQGFSAKQIAEKIKKETEGIFPTKKSILDFLKEKGIKRRNTSQAIKSWSELRGGPWNKGLTKEEHPSIMKYAVSRMGENNPYYLMDEESRARVRYWEYKSEEELKEIRSRSGDALKKKYESGEVVPYAILNPEWEKENLKKRREGYERWLKENKEGIRLPTSKKERKIGKILVSLGKKFSKQFNIEGERFRYDFMLKEEKLIIEFNGTYWHCDPRKYEENFFHTKKQKTAKEIWEYDKQKRIHAEKNGYGYLVIWEDDIRKKTTGEFEDCVKEEICKYVKLLKS